MDSSSLACPNGACPDKGITGGGPVRSTCAHRAALPLPHLCGDGEHTPLPLTSPGGDAGAGAHAAPPRLPDPGQRGRLRAGRAHGARLATQRGDARRPLARPEDSRGRDAAGAGRRAPGARRGGVGGGGARCGPPPLAGPGRRPAPRRPARPSDAAPHARPARPSGRPAGRGRRRPRRRRRAPWSACRSGRGDAGDRGWCGRRGSRSRRWSRPACTGARGACAASSWGRRRRSRRPWPRAMVAHRSPPPPARGDSATVRARLAPLTRRRRTPAHGAALVDGGLPLLRLVSNGCWLHASLRLRARGPGRRSLERTPAMAAGLADRPYHLAEVVRLPAHPIPLTAPRAPRRGRPSTRGRLVPFPHPGAAPPERSAA